MAAFARDDMAEDWRLVIHRNRVEARLHVEPVIRGETNLRNRLAVNLEEEVPAESGPFLHRMHADDETRFRRVGEDCGGERQDRELHSASAYLICISTLPFAVRSADSHHVAESRGQHED